MKRNFRTVRIVEAKICIINPKRIYLKTIKGKLYHSEYKYAETTLNIINRISLIIKIRGDWITTEEHLKKHYIKVK